MPSSSLHSHPLLKPSSSIHSCAQHIALSRERKRSHLCSLLSFSISMAGLSCINLFCFFFLLLLTSVPTSVGLEFHVGGSRGWTVPAGDEAESYNRWAMRNRFHVGDSLYFKYKNDSVLVVDREAYGECNTTAPLLEFDDENTTFPLDRYGFFYFVSGRPGHCEAGQRLIVRVMVHPEFAAAASPGPAPGLQPGRGSSGSGSDTGLVVGHKRSDAALLHAGFCAVMMAGLGGGVLFV